MSTYDGFKVSKRGGGIGMGKTCEPKAFSFQCITKFTPNKIKKKKKEKNAHYVSEKPALMLQWNN